MTWISDEVTPLSDSSFDGNLTVNGDLDVNGDINTVGQLGVGAAPRSDAMVTVKTTSAVADNSNVSYGIHIDTNVVPANTDYYSAVHIGDTTYSTATTYEIKLRTGYLSTNSTYGAALADQHAGLAYREFIHQYGTDNSYLNGSIHHSGSDYGFVHDTGLWEDLRFPAQGINPAGSTAPPDVSTATGMLMFGASTNEIIAGVAQMPHSWKSGTNISPHVHVMADAATNPRAAATATAADGVTTADTNYFTSATGGFTGHANEYLVITVTGTNSKAVVGSYQIDTVVSDTNVLLKSFPGGNAADDSVTWAIYPDTVALKFEYKVMDVGDTWNQTAYTADTIYFQLSAHDGNSVHQIAGAFADINMSGIQDSAMVAWRFTRLGDSAGDTYADDLHLLELDFHYKANTLGSLAEYGEDF